MDSRLRGNDNLPFMKRVSITIFLLLFISLVLVKKVKAVTTSISSTPQNISTDPFTIKVIISGASSGTNYLRIDLYKPSTANYFGETFIGSDWYSGSDHTQYYPITAQSGIEWSGEIQGRFGNPSSNQYDGTGTYKLRVRRHTQSGSYNSTEANNSAVDVTINVSTSTLTPNPTPTQISSPTENQSSSPTLTEIVLEPTSSISVQPQNYNNIYISEVMIDPETGANEWIEIYNGNDYEIILTDWYIDDIENSGSTPKKFSLIINPKDYSVIDLSTSMFNNDGDSARLLDFSQKEIDSFQYQSSEKGKSLGRRSFDNDSFCLQIPTKQASNGSCTNPSAIPTPKPTASSTSINTSTNTPIKTPSITKSPTKTSSTITPGKYTLFTQNQLSVSNSPEETNTDVLGAKTKDKSSTNSQTNALLSSLSFASFAYSLLAIISIFLKMKINT